MDRQYMASSVLALVCVLSLALTARAGAQVRDTSAVPVAGTGVIAGVVVTHDETARPVRRAIVTVSGGGMTTSRSAITDDAGRFVIDRLPEGRFSITVKKAAHIPGAYGALRPGRPGTPLALAAGARADVTLRLARAAVLAGVIRDQAGAPVPSVQVSALRIPASGTSANLFATSEMGVTDDRGMYRIFGLLPGEYVVAVNPRVTGTGEIGQRSESEMEATLSALQRRGGRGGASSPVAPTPAAAASPPASFIYVPTYYAGASSFAGASRIRLGPGDERLDVDFVVSPARTAIIEGAIVGAGNAHAAVQLSIQPDGPRTPSSFSSYPVLTLRPGEVNQFRYTSVAPGRYRVMARLGPRTDNSVTVAGVTNAGAGRVTSGSLSASSPDTLYGVADVDISGMDLTGVILALQPGAIVSGRVVFDSTSAKRPEDLSRMRVNLSPPGGTYMSSSGGTVVGNLFNSVAPAEIRPDGTFTATGIAPGTYLLRATMPTELGQTWTLQSAVVNGQDVLDVPLEISPGTTISDAVLTFSDSHSELTGTLQTSAGTPAPDYFIVAFSQTRTYWTPQSRRLKSVRPGTDGRFTIKDLPAGDYFIAALTDVDPDEWQTPAFLDQLVSAAIKISITPGGRVTQDIRVVR